MEWNRIWFAFCSFSVFVLAGNSAAIVIKMWMLPGALAPSARGLIDRPTTLLAQRLLASPPACLAKGGVSAEHCAMRVCLN